MNYLILTPDGVGSTILQRLITIHLHLNAQKVVNTHEITNGIELKNGIAYKNFDLDYSQSLEEIQSLLSKSDTQTSHVSRMAKYHITNRSDALISQSNFFSFLKKFFDKKIMCLRKNVFEYALSWSIRNKSGVLNITSKNDRAKVLAVDTVDEDFFISRCKNYVEYIAWIDEHFPGAEQVYYEDIVNHTDSTLEKITGISPKFQSRFGLTISEILKKEFEVVNCLSANTKIQLTRAEKSAIISYKRYINQLVHQNVLIDVPIKNTTLTDKKNQIKNFNECLHKFENFAKNYNWIDQSIATFDFYTGGNCA